MDANNRDTQSSHLYWLPLDPKRKSNKWDLTYLDELKGEYKTGELNKEYGWIVNTDFYIVSQMPSRRFLTKIGSYGVGIKTRYEIGTNTQKWYFDERTKNLKNRAQAAWSLEIQNNGKSSSARLYTGSHYWWHRHRFNGQNIVNEHNGRVLDVAGNSDVEGQSVIWHPRHNGANQRWKVILCSKLAEPVRGFNAQFGFYMNKPFFLIS